MTLSRIHRLLIALLAVGSLSATIAVPVVDAKPKHHKVTHHTTHKTKKKSSGCHIAQKGGGDGDQDNFGGPSDGDGCM
jgi:hypothetical protein